MKKNSVIDIANYFICLASQEKEEQYKKLSNLKLQKLCYIAHGICLAAYEEPLFKEEVEAWPHGPVIPKLYDDKYIKNWRTPCLREPLKYALDIKEQNKKDCIAAVWGRYKMKSAVELVDLTHRVNTPWFKIRNFSINEIIPNELTKEYYRKILKGL